MGRKLTNEELREYAVINWRLAEQAEKEGNHELARELADIARDADLQAAAAQNTSAPFEMVGLV